jgi:hypothetical protein
LLYEVATVLIDSLMVYGSPLGNPFPLKTWPASCLLMWRVDGANYVAPRPTQGLSEYLGCVAEDKWYLVEQQCTWLSYLKPVSIEPCSFHSEKE